MQIQPLPLGKKPTQHLTTQLNCCRKTIHVEENTAHLIVGMVYHFHRDHPEKVNMFKNISKLELPRTNRTFELHHEMMVSVNCKSTHFRRHRLFEEPSQRAIPSDPRCFFPTKSDWDNQILVERYRNLMGSFEQGYLII